MLRDCSISWASSLIFLLIPLLSEQSQTGSRVGNVIRDGLGHVKTCLRAYADNADPDQPAHPRSLIRAFTFR